MNEIFFLISFSVSLLFVYLKAADFYILIFAFCIFIESVYSESFCWIYRVF